MERELKASYSGVLGEPSQNKKNAGNGSKLICSVGDVLRSPSPDFNRSANP